jgi:colanic acid/amylovoran biosynthesis glycosyltransferase
MTVGLSRFLFALQVLRLRLESLLFPGRRVLATACWAFPIYSQTFVYQELTQLIKAGYRVRFLYGHLDRTTPLAAQFRPLWRARRRLILHPAVCEASLQFFARHFPERFERLIATLCRESAMTREEILGHYHVRQGFAFARLALAYRPDYVHSYFFYEGTLFAMMAAELLDIPRGVSCYADHMLEDYPLKLVPFHLRRCSTLVATSRRIQAELLGLAPGMPPDTIVVKPNAINAAHFPVVKRTDPSDGQPFRLVSVCRIEPKKGLIELVEAVGLLRGRGLLVEAHLIGGVDDSESSRAYDAALRERIAALNLADHIVLAGRRSEAEINECFRASHVFVAPFVETVTGDKDGVPTSLLEGMSSALPVVATDAGSITEVITHEEDGLIVPQKDPRALADAVARLLRDPELRAVLGARAASRVRETFNVSTCEKALHAHLASLLASPRGAGATRAVSLPPP